MNSFRRLLLVAATAGCALGQGAKPIRPVTVTISTETPTIKAGSVLEIKAELTNVSDLEVDCSEGISNMSGQSNNWLLDVRDVKGGKVPRKSYEHEELASVKILFHSLKPKESLTASIIVSRQYDLSPGKYSIQVTRAIPDEDGALRRESPPHARVKGN